jgi:hypothetical protein
MLQIRRLSPSAVENLRERAVSSNLTMAEAAERILETALTAPVRRRGAPSRAEPRTDRVAVPA